jgi:hypothetical protein
MSGRREDRRGERRRGERKEGDLRTKKKTNLETAEEVETE